MKLTVPPRGSFYHGVYPGTATCTGKEDDIQLSDLLSYESKETGVNRKAAWVYFSNNWDTEAGRKFPDTTAKWIRQAGSVPFIRLMLRSTTVHNTLKLKYEKNSCEEIKGLCDPEKTNDKISCNFETKYTLDFILSDPQTEADLIQWGKDAAAFGTPLIVEWGTEMNGYWFAWNGWWNGKAEGVEKFKKAFRRIRNLITEKGGAKNITWVFHVNNGDAPSFLDHKYAPKCSMLLDAKGKEWNRLENYYPGDDVVDWLGVSVYGAQRPTDGYCTPFNKTMSWMYDRLAALTPAKPIMLLEFGVTMNNTKHCGKEPSAGQCADIKSGAAKWADDALNDILTNEKYKDRLRGFSWWNECWENDDKRQNDTNMRVQTVPCLKEVFQRKFDTNDKKIIQRPIYQPI